MPEPLVPGGIYEFDSKGYARFFAPKYAYPTSYQFGPQKVIVTYVGRTWGKPTCTVRTRSWGASDVPIEFVGQRIK